MRNRIPDMPPGAAAFLRNEVTGVVLHSVWLPEMTDAQKEVIKSAVVLAVNAEIPGVPVELFFHPKKEILLQIRWAIGLHTKSGNADHDDKEIWHAEQAIIDAYAPRLHAIRNRAWNFGYDLAEKLVQPIPHKRVIKPRQKAVTPLKRAA